MAVEGHSEPRWRRAQDGEGGVRTVSIKNLSIKTLWLPIALALLVVAAAALAGSLYWTQYRPDKQTDAAAERTVIDAASAGAVALLSYSPDTLDKDFSAAKSHLTGDFLTYYSQFSQQIVAPAAKQRGVKTTASVVQSAVSELRPDSAVVLLFIDQDTRSAERPQPSLAASSVRVTMAKSGGNWLISKFDPI
ncbi:twin-arginine translocation pathway signal [Mycolicibacterium sp. CBMA 234]|uniref:twin-arginine translocation pathway signal n=1 Tax=Mycolicibacterium sp. CBMA 234 TaxID=1918495 RepID=UPI0035CD05C4